MGRSHNPLIIIYSISLLLLGTSRRNFFAFMVGAWDSNPRPSPCQGDALPLSYAPATRQELTIASQFVKGKQGGSRFPRGG